MAVKRLIGLRPGSPYGRAFFGIEQPELNPGIINRSTHLAAERVDLFNQVAFADSANGRIARHLADMIEIECQHESAASHACRGQTCFDSGMPGTNDDDVKSSVVNS